MNVVRFFSLPVTTGMSRMHGNQTQCNNAGLTLGQNSCRGLFVVHHHLEEAATRAHLQNTSAPLLP
jgi:hypothetical protein